MRNLCARGARSALLGIIRVVWPNSYVCVLSSLMRSIKSMPFLLCVRTRTTKVCIFDVIQWRYRDLVMRARCGRVSNTIQYMHWICMYYPNEMCRISIWFTVECWRVRRVNFGVGVILSMGVCRWETLFRNTHTHTHTGVCGFRCVVVDNFDRTPCGTIRNIRGLPRPRISHAQRRETPCVI